MYSCVASCLRQNLFNHLLIQQLRIGPHWHWARHKCNPCVRNVSNVRGKWELIGQWRRGSPVNYSSKFKQLSPNLEGMRKVILYELKKKREGEWRGYAGGAGKSFLRKRHLKAGGCMAFATGQGRHSHRSEPCKPGTCMRHGPGMEGRLERPEAMVLGGRWWRLVGNAAGHQIVQGLQWAAWKRLSSWFS